jgi:hypothetical protein
VIPWDLAQRVGVPDILARAGYALELDQDAPGLHLVPVARAARPAHVASKQQLALPAVSMHARTPPPPRPARGKPPAEPAKRAPVNKGATPRTPVTLERCEHVYQAVASGAAVKADIRKAYEAATGKPLGEQQYRMSMDSLEGGKYMGPGGVDRRIYHAGDRAYTRYATTQEQADKLAAAAKNGTPASADKPDPAPAHEPAPTSKRARAPLAVPPHKRAPRRTVTTGD